MSGVLVEQSDFYVTLRQADGTIRAVPTTGAKVVTTNPLQAHIDLLDRITDKQIHDLVAYLETLEMRRLVCARERSPSLHGPDRTAAGSDQRAD